MIHEIDLILNFAGLGITLLFMVVTPWTQYDHGEKERGVFETTQWSVVRRAGMDDQASREALEQLCNDYWTPLFIFLRRKGYTADQSEDELQAFFLTFLEKGYVSDADQERGRFRTFMITALVRFLSKSREKRNALKRGGGVAPISLDGEKGEELYQRLGNLDRSPEDAFERQWAYRVLEQALESLEAHYDRIGKGRLYASIRHLLDRPGTSINYEDVAQQLSMKTGALRVAVHRMKQRYKEQIEDVIKETVENEDELRSEIEHLMEALSR